MTEIKSVLLIDKSDIDNFINHKILESHGVTNVTVLKNAVTALPFLAGTTLYYQYILVDVHLPIINGFQFIEI